MSTHPAPRPTSPTRYAECARLVRALAAGGDAFLAALADGPNLDPDALLAFAEHHRVGPWLAQALDHERATAALPAGLRAQLLEMRTLQQRRVDALLRQCNELQQAFAAADVDFLLLKGLYFGEHVYGDPCLRPQWDVDVLVRPERLETALGALGQRGYDIQTNTENQRPVAERLDDIRRRPREARHAVTVRRRGEAVDLHWSLRRRLYGRIDHERLFDGRQSFAVGGSRFETLSDADALTFLLVSIGGDVKRGACRARQLLDLYLLLRRLGDRFDWSGYLARRREEGLLPLAVNVLALLFHAWGCASDLPEPARAVEARRRLLAFRGRAEALALLTQARGTPQNRIWFRRIAPRSPLRRLGWALTADLPYHVRRWMVAPPGASKVR